MRNHHKLRAFELADDLVIEVYRITKTFPKDELYGLTSQIRKCAISIPSNIVEGSYRESQKDYRRFLEVAFGSLKEMRYQFSIARWLGFIDIEDLHPFNDKIIETEKVLGALVLSMRVWKP